jgi:hypothetical protein
LHFHFQVCASFGGAFIFISISIFIFHFHFHLLVTSC